MKLKRKPSRARHLNLAAVAAPGRSTTLERVMFCIDPYTNIDPILPQYHVGSLCPELDFLGSDLNVEFRLQGRQQYWHGEIEGTWSVQDLADYTDLKKQQQP